MAEKNIYQVKAGGKDFKFQLEGMADQASGSCLVAMAETSVLTTAVIGQERPEMGFFPLTCEYEERFYAAGKILGSRFVRREGRPSLAAVLISRMIDRTIRPVFPEKLSREIQCIATCLSWDGENDPAILGLLGTSLSLGLSDIPWDGPIAAVRVAKINDELVAFPTYQQREGAVLDIVFSGLKRDNEILLNMIESRADEQDEETILDSFDFAQNIIKELIEFQEKIIKEKGKKKIILPSLLLEQKAIDDWRKFLLVKLEKAVFQKDRYQSKQDTSFLKDEFLSYIINDFGEGMLAQAKDFFESEKEKLIDEKVLEEEKRVDNRKLDEIRDIEIEVACLPRTHGSAIFRRGETRVLSILTLGAPGDQQILEGMDFSGKKRFMHHYNFPPYSVGEVKRLMGPGRRELGHGMLAEKAILPLIPKFEEFPYTIRIVSEVLSSNGSSSMAAACAASLALMDAGVPIKNPVAGVAIGLIKKSNKDYKILTDIQGPEDSCGDMDFKAAGTAKGVTVLQMDVKVNGITREILQKALEESKKARLQILQKIKDVLPMPRKELSPFAPRVFTLQINPEKIGAVIGTGGKVINEIIDECQVEIDIEESGLIFVTAEKEESAQKALDWIKGLTREFKPGENFSGRVARLMEFGAFVEIAPGQSGLLHISEFTSKRGQSINNFVKIGDNLLVEIKNIDDQGRINFLLKK